MKPSWPSCLVSPFLSIASRPCPLTVPSVSLSSCLTRGTGLIDTLALSAYACSALGLAHSKTIESRRRILNQFREMGSFHGKSTRLMGAIN